MLSNVHRGLTPELIKRAEIELGETDEVRTLAIKELKRLIKDEPDFNPCTDDAFLIKFLRARKYNAEKTFKTMKNYYLYKAQNSGVLTDLRPSDYILRADQLKGSPLEHRDQNQCLVGYIRLGKVDTDILSPEEVLGVALLMTEIVLESEVTQVAGYCILIDFTDFSLRKARHYASPSYLYKMVSAIQDCYPSRIKAFHVVNEPFYFDIIFNILRPFLSEKLKKRFHFHGNNLESLHKYLSPDILPEELAGKQGPSEINEKKFFKYICDNEDFFKRMQKFGYTGKTLQKLSKDNKNAVLN